MAHTLLEGCFCLKMIVMMITINVYPRFDKSINVLSESPWKEGRNFFFLNLSPKNSGDICNMGNRYTVIRY